MTKTSLQAYKEKTIKNKLLIGVLIVVTFGLAVFAINSGAAKTTLSDVISALLNNTTGDLPSVVIWNIRLPRILAGIIAGIGLAVSGCVMQTALNNPLASPSTLGISNAAAFGANLAILFFGAGGVNNASQHMVSVENPYIVTILAFVFSIIASVLILGMAKMRNFSPETVVLAGVAFGSLFTAGSTLLQYFAEDVQVAAMVFWTFGDLGRVSWQEVAILAVVVMFAFIYFLFHRWDFNALGTGDESAKSLGVDVDGLRFGSMLASALISSVAVSFMGIIGFVGLIAPQIMRRVLGSDHRFLIPASAVLGSVILLFSDTLARTIVSPVILPVGAITSFLGAPLFLFLLFKGKKGGR